jgi:malonyl CoA-acyl carrier protein transacylase
VSALRRELDQIEKTLQKRNLSFQRLPVSVPFHSRWIECAKAAFDPFSGPERYAKGCLPLMCCDRAVTLSLLPGDYFWNVVRRPIRFHDATIRMEKRGSYRYIDVGPAGTLATFLKYGLPRASKSRVHAILTPFGVDQKNFAAVASSVRN